MSETKRTRTMLIPTVVMAVLAVTLLLIGYFRGEGQHIAGLKNALSMVWTVLPLLICAFIISGMIQVLIPVQTISNWVGAESGLRGIFFGCLAGSLAPGGPFVNLPVAAALVRSGAGVATMVSFLTAWSLWSIPRLSMEIGILGWRLTAARWLSTFIFPPIAGLIAYELFSRVK